MNINGIEISKAAEERLSRIIAWRLYETGKSMMLMKSQKRREATIELNAEIEMLKEIQEAIGYATDVGTVHYSDCEECGKGKLVGQPGGGVKCTECNYWFCY